MKDATGKQVGVTTTDMLYTTGIAHVLVNGVKPGKYTITVTGDYAVSDPDTLDSDSVKRPRGVPPGGPAARPLRK